MDSTNCRLTTDTADAADSSAAGCATGARDSSVAADEGRSCVNEPKAQSWPEAVAAIDEISRGWMYVERDDLYEPGAWQLREHELDSFGNEAQPSGHGFFKVPGDAVKFAATLWRRRTKKYPRSE